MCPLGMHLRVSDPLTKRPSKKALGPSDSDLRGEGDSMRAVSPQYNLTWFPALKAHSHRIRALCQVSAVGTNLDELNRMICAVQVDMI